MVIRFASSNLGRYAEVIEIETKRVKSPLAGYGQVGWMERQGNDGNYIDVEVVDGKV